jgi:hypothetical protein
MKNIIYLITITAILTTLAMAQTQEKRVAFRVNAERPVRYLTADRGNRMRITGSEIGPNQEFTLIDTNGGDLADGDDVQIKHVTADGKITTYCWEHGDTFSRTPKSADPATHFKIKKTTQGISLQTVSGKFVAVPPTTKDLAYTDDAPKAVVFEVIERPTSKGAAESKSTTSGT